MKFTTRHNIIRENIRIAKMVWKELSEVGKDCWFCSEGTYGFIEAIFVLTKNQDILIDLSMKEFEAIHKEVFSND